MNENIKEGACNKKLMIWFCGTLEQKNIAKSNLKALKSNDPSIKTVVIDGVATSKNRSDTNKMRNDSGTEGLIRKVGNLIGDPVGVVKDIFGGYEEASHLVQLEKALIAINSHIKENSGMKSDLIVGGFSRGAAVALPVFLGALAEASKSKVLQEKEQLDSNYLFKEHFNKISVIAVDPVPGINKQDTFGLDTLANQENPLKVIFETLNAELKMPMDVTYMPSNYDMLEGLEGGENWNNLANDPPQGIEIKIHQAGVNHLSMTLPFSDHRYNKEATPRKLLNRVIQEKLETVPQDVMSLDEMQEKVTKVDARIITDIALGYKIPKGSELLSTATRGLVKSLHLLGGPQGRLINLNTELTEQLKNPTKPKIIGGRPMDASKLGLKLNVKGKLIRNAHQFNSELQNMTEPVAELDKNLLPLSKVISEAKDALIKAEAVTKSIKKNKNLHI